METLQDAYNAQEYAALVKELAAAVFSFNTSVSLSRSFCDSGSFVEDIFTGIAVGSWEKQQEQTVTICLYKLLCCCLFPLALALTGHWDSSFGSSIIIKTKYQRSTLTAHLDGKGFIQRFLKKETKNQRKFKVKKVDYNQYDLPWTSRCTSVCITKNN